MSVARNTSGVTPGTDLLLREGQLVARLASWEWDPRTDALRVSDAAPLKTAGLRAPVIATMGDAIASIVDPRDRELVARALLDAAEGGRPAQVRYRARVPNSEITWLEMRATAINGDDGATCIVRGTTQDVTEQEQARREERRQRDFYQATLDSLPAHVAVLDESGVILSTNLAWDRFAAANGGRSDWEGSNYLAVCERDAPEVVSALREMLDGARDAFELEYECHSPEQERFFVMRASRFRSSGPPRLVIQHEDISARCRAEQAARLRADLLDAVDAAVVAIDTNGTVTEWNQGATRLYGWDRAEAVGRPITSLTVDVASGEDAGSIIGRAKDRGHWEGRLVVRRKDGTTFPAHVRDRRLVDEHGRPSGLVGVSVDVSDQVRHERELASARDYLRAVTDSMGEGVCTLDLDGNLVYMNRAAEEMLGWRLEELAGRNMHAATHHRRADHTLLSVADCPIRRARHDGAVVRVEDDVFVRRDGSDLPVAYTAAPFTTAEGVRGAVIVFSDISERKAEQRRLEAQLEQLTWVGRVRDALAHDRFVLFAQPIIDIGTGRTVQHELLIRMRDGDDLIPPGAFLPVAEEYGLITEIDRWVIGEAARLAGEGHPVELNVSARSLNDPGLADVVERELHAANADPRLIVLELTETALLDSEARGRDFIRRMERLGCKVALDDFGTGYGGFTYLKRLPVDYLKIDIEFVRDLPRDQASRHVVAAVVSLARGFGQKTVAEGVEDDETLECLRELGVDYAQGFAIGRPAPAAGVLGRREELRTAA